MHKARINNRFQDAAAISNSSTIPSTILPTTDRSSVEQFANKKGLPVKYIKHKFCGKGRWY
jgi:hypothetical protein